MPGRENDKASKVMKRKRGTGVASTLVNGGGGHVSFVQGEGDLTKLVKRNGLIESGKEAVENGKGHGKKRKRSSKGAGISAGSQQKKKKIAQVVENSKEEQHGRVREEDKQNGLTSLSMGERAWQYVQRRSVLVSQPPLLDSSGEEDGLTKPADEKPGVVGNGVEWMKLCRTLETQINVFGKKVSVTVTREAAVVDEWVRYQKGGLFGMDTEWQPNFRKGGKENKIALLQISGETECLIVQMLYLDSMPAGLVAFLKDPEKQLAGVGISGDASKLVRDYGLVCNGQVELTSLAASFYKMDCLKNFGLKRLAKKVIHIEMDKPKRVTMSNWSKAVLDSSQMQYACTDAWISFAILHAILLGQAK